MVKAAERRHDSCAWPRLATGGTHRGNPGNRGNGGFLRFASFCEVFRGWNVDVTSNDVAVLGGLNRFSQEEFFFLFYLKVEHNSNSASSCSFSFPAKLSLKERCTSISKHIKNTPWVRTFIDVLFRLVDS